MLAKLVFVLALCMGPGAVVAQTAAEFEKLYLTEQFGGFDGLTLHCEFGRENNQTADRLCDWAKDKARILARQSGSKLTVVTDDPNTRFLERRKLPGDNLELVLYLTTTTPKADGVIAVFAALRVAPFVTVPVGKLQDHKRGGTLIMWERHSIASGVVGSDLDIALQQAFEGHFMKFLNDFAEGQSK